MPKKVPELLHLLGADGCKQLINFLFFRPISSDLAGAELGIQLYAILLRNVVAIRGCVS